MFPSKYCYSPADHLDINDFTYHDEACQSVSESPLSIVCSRMMGTPKLMDCDLGPDNGLPSGTTESFYSLNLNSSIDQHTFTFIFNNLVNLTALSLHYYCTADMQEDTSSFCVYVHGNFLPLCLPCVNNHKQRATLNYKILKPIEQLLMFISSDNSSQLYISEIQFFTEGM